MPTRLDGDKSLRKALFNFVHDLSAAIYEEMDRVFKPIVTKARGFIPSKINLSGWQKGTQKGFWEYRAWDRNEAIAGIGYSVKPSKPNRSGFVSLARIVNASAAGAIYETAGRKRPNGSQGISINPYAGEQFIDALNEQGPLVSANNQVGPGRRSRKMTGRAIFRAWKEDGGKTNSAVVKAIESSKKEFYGQIGYK